MRKIAGVVAVTSLVLAAAPRPTVGEDRPPRRATAKPPHGAASPPRAPASPPRAPASPPRAPASPSRAPASPPPYEAATVDLGLDAANVVPTDEGVALVTLWAGTSAAVVDPHTGVIVRVRQLDGDCHGADVANDGLALLFAVCEEELVAIDPVTLAERWRAPLGGFNFLNGAISARPDLVLVPTYVPEPGNTGRGVMWLVALDASGHERWRVALRDVGPRDVLDGGGRVYVVEHDTAGHVAAFDRLTGAPLWERAMDAGVADAALVDGQTLALARPDGLVLVDAATGADRARVTDGAVWKLALAGDWILTIEPGDAPDGPAGRLHGRNLATGAEWTFASPVWSGAITVADDVAVVSSDNGVLHGIDVATGGERWWIDGGYAREVTAIGAHRLLTIRENSGFAIETDRTSTAPLVTVRGRLVEACGARRGQRVWIGNRVVRTDRAGRFRARVRGGARITVSADERDTRSDVGPEVRSAGESLSIRLTTFKGGCY